MAKAKSGEDEKKKKPAPGVVLIPPKGRYVTWRARFEDPDEKFAREAARPPRRPPRKSTDGDAAPKEKRKDLRKFVFVSLDNPKLVGDSKQAEKNREIWAHEKSEQLKRRRAELEKGAPRKQKASIAESIASFLAAKRRLDDRTLRDYRTRAEAFAAWAYDAGLNSLDDITKARLLEYRDYVLNAPNERAKEGKLRSDFTVNRILRETSVWLHWLAERGRLPACNAEDLKTGLKRVKASLDRIEFLGRGEPAALLKAVIEHDARTYKITREEHRGDRKPGTTPRYEAMAPFVLTLLLTGMRFSEALNLKWSRVDLSAIGNDGEPVGEIRLGKHDVKTKKPREIPFDVSPSLRELFAALADGRTGAGERVFGELTREVCEAARKRIRSQRNAPSFSFQALRRTCGSYLSNAPGLYGAAAPFHSAKRLGHSVAVAEKHYLGTVKGIPREARTLEQAMQIETEAQQVIALVRERQASQAQAAE